MNSLKARFLRITAALAMAGLLAYPATLRAQSTSSWSLTGTWLVQVTLYPFGTLDESGACVPSGIPSSMFSSFISFAEGGTLTATTSNPTFGPGQRSPDHGFWKAMGPANTYQAVDEAYILYNSTTPPYFVQGTQKISQTITQTGPNKWNSVALVKFFKQDGTLAPQYGCATASATRMTANPNKP